MPICALASLVSLWGPGCSDSSGGQDAGKQDRGPDLARPDAGGPDRGAPDRGRPDLPLPDAAPPGPWAVSAGGTKNDDLRGMAVDRLGNSVVVGHFEDTASFGSHTVTSAGNNDVYVARLDAHGRFAWAVSAGGASFDEGMAVGLDDAGNSYVTGTFFPPASFGTLSLTASSGGFVALLDKNGKWQWVMQAGTVARGVAVDKLGAAYVTGDFAGQMQFGSTYLTSRGGNDIFVARVLSSSHLIWAVSGGGSGADAGHGAAVDSSGNPYITGKFGGGNGAGAVFGSLSVSNSGGGGADLFVARLEKGTGRYTWATAAGGLAAQDEGHAVVVDGSGNVYVTGQFGGGSHPGASFGTLSLSSVGGLDIFAARLDSNGKFVWAASGGGQFDDHGRDIAVDSKGNTYVAGEVYQTAATFGSLSLPSRGRLDDVFVARLDSNGRFDRLEAAGSGSDDVGRGVGVDSEDNSYVAGRYGGSFGNSGSFGGATLTARGYADVFVWRRPR